MFLRAQSILLGPGRAGILLAFVLTGSWFAEASAQVDGIRERWRTLVAQDAELLAPKGHRETLSTMEALEQAVAKGEVQEIEKQSVQATKRLDAVEETITRARSLWAAILEVRRTAIKADAPERAPQEWRRAENVLFAAAQKLEVGRQRAAERQVEAVSPLYERARLAALGVGLLDEAKKALARAEELEARKYVPRSHVRAHDALKKADELLQRKGQVDAEVQAKAEAAIREAEHTRFLAERFRASCQGFPDQLEGTVLGWEEALRRVLVLLEMELDPRAGLDKPLQLLGVEVDRLRRERDVLREGIETSTLSTDSIQTELVAQKRKSHALELELVELRRLQEDLEGVTRIQGLFGPNEGRVLVENRDIILRLHGVRFPSSEAEIPAGSRDVLDKVVQCLELFPGSLLIIEGHTDSSGQEEKNVALSQSRADAVRDYLTQKVNLDSERITTLGYGSNRPVASNETDEGRELNRRIEVVIARPI